MDKPIYNNRDHFERLYNLHHQRVYVLCLRMTGNVPEAVGLTEEVFVQVFRHLQSFPTEAAFSTWLYRLTINRVLRHFRKSADTRDKTSTDDELPTIPLEGSAYSNREPVLKRWGGASRSRLQRSRMKLRQLLTRRIAPDKIDNMIGHNPLK